MAGRKRDNLGKAAKAKARPSATLPTVALGQNGDTAINRLEKQLEVKTSQGSKRHRPKTVESKVCKKLRDHFKDWDSHMTDSVLDDSGRPLRQVLTEDQTKSDEGAPDAPVWGKNYYDKLHTRFSLSTSTFRRLRVLDDTQPLNPNMLLGLEGVVSHPRSFEIIEVFLATDEVVDQKSIVLLFKQCLKLSSPNMEVINFQLNVLQYCHRVRVPKLFKTEWGLMVKHFVDVACKSLQHHKNAKMTLDLWFESKVDFLSDLVSVPDFRKLVYHKGEWCDVETELHRFVQASELGRKAFGLAWRELQRNKVQTHIDHFLKQLASADITQKSVQKQRQAFVEKLKEAGRDAKELTQQRNTEVEYRGCKCVMVCTSYLDEYMKHEWAMVEGMAVELGLLPSLWCEDSLVKTNNAKPTVTIEEAVLASAALARRGAAEALPGLATSDAIMATLTSKHAVLCGLHKGWVVQRSFWESVIGSNSEERLLNEVLECLPSDARQITRAESVGKLEELSRSKLLQFCGLGLQAVFTTAKNFVTDLRNELIPKFDGKHDSRFMKRVMEKAGLWCTCAKAAAAYQPAETLKGADAAKHVYDNLCNDHAGGQLPTLKQVGALQTFGFLLTDDQRGRLDNMTNDAAQANMEVAAAAVVTQTASSKGAGKGKRGKRSATSARDQVLALLA